MKPNRTLNKTKEDGTLLFPRTEPEIPNEVTGAILTDPKAKHRTSFKKTMSRARHRAVEFPRTEPKPYERMLEEWAKSKSMRQLLLQSKRSESRIPRITKYLEALRAALAETPASIDLQNKAKTAAFVLYDRTKHYEACRREIEARQNRKVVGK